MTATHAQIARNVVAMAPPGVFARAALPVVTQGSFVALEKMLPGIRWASRKLGPDKWELVGTCVDGSSCIWILGE